MLRFPIAILSFICAVTYGQSNRSTKQVEVEKDPDAFLLRNAKSPGFEREFDYRTGTSFTNPIPNTYLAEKVKTVELYNLSDQLFYRCELDEEGQVVKTGIQGKKYFITSKDVVISESHSISEKGYYKDDVLMRLDTVINYLHVYAVGDTILSFYERQTLSYMKGGLINRKNRYLNEKYLNKQIEYSRNPLDLFQMIEEKTEEDNVYFKKPLKVDYDSLTLFLTKNVRYFSSPNYQLGGREITWKNVQTHPFFYLVNQRSIEFYQVDGAGFQEPVKYFDTGMSCGYANYERQHYDDGKSYRYTRLENDLYDSYVLHYRPVDPNPPKRKTIPKDSIKTDIGTVNINSLMAKEWGPRRLPTAEINVIYNYRYTYFE